MVLEEQISQIQFSIKTDIINGTLSIKVILNQNHSHTLLLNSQTLMNHSNGLTLIIIMLAYSTYSWEQRLSNQVGVDNTPQQHFIQEKEPLELEKIMDTHKMLSNKQLLSIQFLSQLRRRPHPLLTLVYQKINQLKMHH